VLRNQAFDLVDRDERGAPGHLERLHVGQNSASKRGTAEAERTRGLAARIRKALDVGCFANDGPNTHFVRRKLVVATRLVGAPVLPSTRHAYSVHE
jgi:hypothetical protein